jgi:Protein of unknown function (DUF2924)
MADPVLTQLAALKTAPVVALKQKWRELFEGEPPPYNRRFLESRLAYRIQELAFGGLSKEGHAQGCGAPWRARRNYRTKPLGPGP